MKYAIYLWRFPGRIWKMPPGFLLLIINARDEDKLKEDLLNKTDPRGVGFTNKTDFLPRICRTLKLKKVFQIKVIYSF